MKGQTMKIKTSGLTGASLDWAVAKCEGVDFDFDSGALVIYGSDYYCPSEDWEQGGPIIEREVIELRVNDPNEWVACMWWDDEESSGDVQIAGPTPLTAAMRCYVSSKLGDEIELPEELS